MSLNRRAKNNNTETKILGRSNISKNMRCIPNGQKVFGRIRYESGKPERIKEITGDNFDGTWFQQDGNAPHYDRDVRAFLDNQFPGRWIGRKGILIDRLDLLI